MALESVKRVAASINTAAPVKSAEPARSGQSESISSTSGGYVEEASTIGGGLQAGTAGEGGEQQPGQDMERKVKAAISHANTQMKHKGKTQCEFSYHEETNRISIKVKDADTGEVIREIPAVETLKMVEKMWELAGILVDERR